MSKLVMKTSAALVLLASLAGAGAAPASQNTPPEVCLQNNRIWSWNALDDRTLVVGDVQNHRFLVKLSGGCIGLSENPILALRFRTWTNLGCLQRGDMVSVRVPTLGPMSCFVDEVQPYAPGGTASAK